MGGCWGEGECGLCVLPKILISDFVLVYCTVTGRLGGKLIIDDDDDDV